MRVALFHDGDPRIPRVRDELRALGHDVVVVDSLRGVHALLRGAATRPDIVHGFGRSVVGVVGAGIVAARFRTAGTKRVHDVVGVTAIVVDGSLVGAALASAYRRALGFG